MLVARLLAFSLALGGLRDPRLFAVAGAAAWAAVWLQRPALGPAAAWLPWLGWAALSTLASAQPLAGLPVLARWAAVLACASLAAAWTAREREAWFKAFLLVAGGLAAAALVTGARHDWRNEMTGLIPPYYNYTAFALAAAAAACGAWALHPRAVRGNTRAAAIALCAVSLICIALARSRGASLGLAVAAAIWACRRWGARAAVPLLAAAALGLGALAGGFLPDRVENLLFKKYRLNAEARPRLWSAAAGVASDGPWLGTGPGNFAVGYRRRPVANDTGASRWSMSTPYAHSEPLQVAAETGWAGLALWLLGAGAVLRVLFRRADGDPVREAAAVAAAAMTAQLAVDNLLQIPALAALWLTALAVAGAPIQTPRWPRAAALAGAALALAAWIPGRLAAVSPARAAVIFPAEPGPREDLAYAATAAGDAAAAEAFWAEAERLEPFNAIYPWRRAQLAGAFGVWARAETLAARAVTLEPGFQSARLLRAEALARSGRTPAAREEIAEVLRRRAAPGAATGSGYDRTVVSLDEASLRRVAGLVGSPPPR